MKNISVAWHGHSCFTVSCDGYSIVLDPYAPDSVPGLSPLALTASQVLCSHGHSDHNYAEAVSISEFEGTSPFQIKEIPSFHDKGQGSKRGENTIFVLESAGLRIAHMGDLGCELTPQQMESLKGIDAILVPVGGYYTIDAREARELVCALNPRVVIPMHYRSDSFGYDEIGSLEEYTELCDDVICYDSNTITIDKSTKKQTAVLKLA